MEPIQIYKRVYRKCLGYELIGAKLNNDGSLTMLHSARFMDEHPERESNEYTQEDWEHELDENLKYMAAVDKCIKTYRKQ